MSGDEVVPAPQPRPYPVMTWDCLAQEVEVDATVRVGIEDELAGVAALGDRHRNRIAVRTMDFAKAMKSCCKAPR